MQRARSRVVDRRREHECQHSHHEHGGGDGMEGGQGELSQALVAR